MRIETDDWVLLSEAAKISKIPETIVRRLAKELGMEQTFFGCTIMRKGDIPKLAERRRVRGNPKWIASSEDAAEDALRAVESRLKKKKSRAAKRSV